MDYFNIAFRLGYAHPNQFLEKLTSRELTETLAYLFIESGNYNKRFNSAKNLKDKLQHLIT